MDLKLSADVQRSIPAVVVVWTRLPCIVVRSSRMSANPGSLCLTERNSLEHRLHLSPLPTCLPFALPPPRPPHCSAFPPPPSKDTNPLSVSCQDNEHPVQLPDTLPSATSILRGASQSHRKANGRKPWGRSWLSLTRRADICQINVEVV